MASGKANIENATPVSGSTGDVTQMFAGSSGHVADGFKPSSYDANLNVTVAGTAVSMALAEGVKLGVGRLHVTNIGATTETMRLAFGTSAADAVSNLNVAGGLGTTGVLVAPLVDGGQPQLIGVPDNATHVAVVNGVASDTPEMTVVQGV